MFFQMHLSTTVCTKDGKYCDIYEHVENVRYLYILNVFVVCPIFNGTETNGTETVQVTLLRRTLASSP